MSWRRGKSNSVYCFVSVLHSGSSELNVSMFKGKLVSQLGHKWKLTMTFGGQSLHRYLMQNELNCARNFYYQAHVKIIFLIDYNLFQRTVKLCAHCLNFDNFSSSFNAFFYFRKCINVDFLQLMEHLVLLFLT